MKRTPPLETSINANAIRVFPGTPVNPDFASDEEEFKVGVYPNPYRINAAWDGSSPFTRKIMFYNLPTKAQIRVYTLSGEIVATLDHDAATYTGGDARWFRDFAGSARLMPGGEHAWDLLTAANQKSYHRVIPVHRKRPRFRKHTTWQICHNQVKKQSIRYETILQNLCCIAADTDLRCSEHAGAKLQTPTQVLVRDLNAYDSVPSSQADLPDNPLVGELVTFDAVVVSYPKNLGSGQYHRRRSSQSDSRICC